jgi:hypothetical protein
MPYKFKNIEIKYLLETGSTLIDSNYKGNDMIKLQPVNTANDIEQIPATYPINYKISKTDITTSVVTTTDLIKSYNAFSTSYKTTGDVKLLIDDNIPNLYYKHISFVIVGGGGGRGGKGGNGTGGFPMYANKDGGMGGGGAKGNIYIGKNVPLSNATKITVTIGSPGNIGTTGKDQPDKSTGPGDDGGTGNTGGTSSVVFTNGNYTATGGVGGGGGGGGNTGSSGSPGTDNTDATVTVTNTNSAKYDAYNIYGTGATKGGVAADSGYVKVWFLYNPS